ncbi:hypothetical protein NDA16_001600 [Ustilago loliicola]|nr:hypothetical protein NDA16_001600 [Ustilago loliicola]
MPAVSGTASSQLTESLRAEAQANLWRGPIATNASGSTSSSSSLTVKPAVSSVRNIKRKPAPKIPTEPLQDASPSTPVAVASTSVLAHKAFDTERDSELTPTPRTPEPTKSAQRPQQQYILDIDAPVNSAESSSATDDAVQRLLRSASVSPASASATAARTRKGPLRWMQDKEEHTSTASTSTLPPSQPMLSRKTSISAHLKLSLRRNKSEDQPAPITISGPTNFVHVATGTEGAYSSVGAAATSLRRASTTSRVSARSSVRSSMSSNYSTSSYVSENTAPSSTEKEATSEDKPLYTAAVEKKHPLRPLKSIRRPSKLSLKPDEPVLDIPAESTSPKDKRKAIYAAPGSRFEFGRRGVVPGTRAKPKS